MGHQDTQVAANQENSSYVVPHTPALQTMVSVDVSDWTEAERERVSIEMQICRLDIDRPRVDMGRDGSDIDITGMDTQG